MAVHAEDAGRFKFGFVSAMLTVYMIVIQDNTSLPCIFHTGGIM